MLKRTKGLMLISLLVITGLAGTLNDDALSNKERKYSANLLKDSKTELLKSVKNLSDAQLNFKTSAESWSVKECVYHIAITEKALWGMLEQTMKATANPEQRPEIKLTDAEFVQRMENRTHKVKTFEKLEPVNTPYKSLDEALDDFKMSRGEHIKYVKTTTEDLRNHVVKTVLGWADCYQITLIVGAHTNRHIQQLNEVKADPNFPK